jgi:hypothetical protein
MAEQPIQSAAEKRKSLGRSVTYPAYIDLGDGSPLRPCTLCGPSQTGAHLALAEPSGVPDEFILALSLDGAARRKCRVISRNETQVGVEFLKDIKKDHAPRSWAMRHSAVAASQTADVSTAAVVKIDVDTLSQD